MSGLWSGVCTHHLCLWLTSHLPVFAHRNGLYYVPTVSNLDHGILAKRTTIKQRKQFLVIPPDSERMSTMNI